MEGEDEAEKGVDEANAALNSVNIEKLPVEEEEQQNEGKGNDQLDVSEIMGVDANLSYDEVLDKLESKGGSQQITPITSNEDEKGEEKKSEPDESEKPAPKSPSKIGAIKNMKNRRKAAAKKKKKKGSS